MIVSSDLNTGKPILHGVLPEDKVLDALLALHGLASLVHACAKTGSLSHGWGSVSNLPVEPALNLGATEIVALDLIDSRRDTIAEAMGFVALWIA